MIWPSLVHGIEKKLIFIEQAIIRKKDEQYFEFSFIFMI